MRRIVAVVLASGNGERSGFTRPKQLAKLAGRPVIAHALEKFQSHPDIDEIAIVTNLACQGEVEGLISRERLTKVKKVLLGGRERHESSLAAIRAYKPAAGSIGPTLIFHDAVRPLVSERVISDVIDALVHYRAVDVAIPASDTVIVADPDTDTIQSIPDRRQIRLGQTPQGFHFEVIERAYDIALTDPNFRATDDCGVVLKYLPDQKIAIVPGSQSNMKLTYADDLMIIDKYMQCNAGRRLDATPEHLLLSQLRGRTIAVFGGTSGIGASLARLAQAYGADVHIASRSTGVDIVDESAVEAFLRKVANHSGRIDAVVNSAAILNRLPLVNMSADEVKNSLEVNVLGAFNVARLSYEHLRASCGHLLFFASSSYTHGRALYSTYSASKSAVVNLTQALADEWSETGIHVNCINPERCKTPMRVKAFGEEASETLLDPDDVARKALSILIGRSTGFIYDVVKDQSRQAPSASNKGFVEPHSLPIRRVGSAFG
jgi:2-C-methyl-D-erythritol 4-phosphate cytidylyltransferase